MIRADAQINTLTTGDELLRSPPNRLAITVLVCWGCFHIGCLASRVILISMVISMTPLRIEIVSLISHLLSNLGFGDN